MIERSRIGARLPREGAVINRICNRGFMQRPVVAPKRGPRMMAIRTRGARVKGCVGHV